MPGSFRLLREWVEATEALREYSEQYVRIGVNQSDRPSKRRQRIFTPEAADEMDRLQRLVEEKWEAYRKSFYHADSERP